jgi:CheY-like chemotaxis protein
LLKAIDAAVGQNDRKAAGAAPTNGGQEMPSRKSVLLVDDNQDFLFSLTRRFQELGIDVIATGNGLDALMQAATQTPDLIILDIALPGVDGMEVCEKLTKNPATAEIPVIILTGKSNNQTIERCKRLGARYVHKKLAYWEELKAVVSDFLDLGSGPAVQEAQAPVQSAPAAKGGSVPKILVIDDDPHMTRALTVRLGALGLDVVEAPNASGGTYMAWTENPDLIITDQNMPEMSGEQLIVKLKSDEATKDIPVVVITGQKVNGQEDMWLKREIVGRRGAVAYLTKPVNFDELVGVLGQYIRIPSQSSGKPARAGR